MSRHRLLVTGSEGFVGGALIEAIGSRYDNFDIIDFIDPIKGSRPDIRDVSSVERALASAQADSLIHLAAIAAPREAKQNPSSAWMTNVIGTLNIANIISRISPNTHLIWSGSSEAYGNTFNIVQGPISENVALEPLTPYGATKAACDIMLRQMANDGLKVTIFRPFNHTGPKQSSDYVIPAFAAQVARIEAGQQEPIIQVGNLEAKRDFLHVSDVVDAYLSAVNQSARAIDKTYNISTGNPVSISHILSGLLDLTSVDIKVQIDQERYAPNSVPIATGDYKRLHDDLGWAPTIDLQQILLEVLTYQRQQVREL